MVTYCATKVIGQLHSVIPKLYVTSVDKVWWYIWIDSAQSCYQRIEAVQFGLINLFNNFDVFKLHNCECNSQVFSLEYKKHSHLVHNIQAQHTSDVVIFLICFGGMSRQLG